VGVGDLQDLESSASSVEKKQQKKQKKKKNGKQQRDNSQVSEEVKVVASLSDDSCSSESKTVSQLELENSKLKSLIKTLRQEKNQLKSDNNELDQQLKSI
jgi:predicted RNase H-like nuclease (RuvC/YqgF family)